MSPAKPRPTAPKPATTAEKVETVSAVTTEKPAVKNETAETAPVITEKVEPKKIVHSVKIDQYYTGPNANCGSLFGVLLDDLEVLSSVSTRLAAADGDRDAAYAAFIATSDNEQAVKLREIISSANAKLKALAEQEVKVETLDDAAKGKLITERNAYADKVRKGHKLILGLAEMTEIDVEGVKEALKKVPTGMKTTKLGAPIGTSGSTLPRVGVNVMLTGGNFTEPQYFDNFAKPALMLGLDVKDMQLAFCAAAGVEHSLMKTAFNDKDKVTFDMQPKPNGAVYTFVATHKKRAPRDSTTSASDDSTEADDSAGEGEDTSVESVA